MTKTTRRIESCEACEGTGVNLSTVHWRCKREDCPECDGSGVQWATAAANEGGAAPVFTITSHYDDGEVSPK